MEDTNAIDVARRPDATPTRESGALWQARTLAELSALQGVSLTPDYGALVGRAKELWADDAELDAFLADLRVSRREGG